MSVELWQQCVELLRDELPAQRMSYADRGFFTRLRDNPGQGRVVDGPLLGRQHTQWIVVLARPLLDKEGRFAGVVYANFRTAFFERILSAPALGPQGAATVRTTDLALVHRFPDTQGAVGSRNVSRELAAAIGAHPQAGEYIAATCAATFSGVLQCPLVARKVRRIIADRAAASEGRAGRTVIPAFMP